MSAESIQDKALRLMLFATGAVGTVSDTDHARTACLLGEALAHLEWACGVLLSRHDKPALTFLNCALCGADRSKEDCKGERMKCPISGLASSGLATATVDANEGTQS